MRYKKGKSKDPRFQSWLDMVQNLTTGGAIYTVWAGDRLLYVGQTQQLKLRLQDHNRRTEFVSLGADSIRFVRTATPALRKDQAFYREQRLAMERFLIHKHNPELNSRLS